MTTKKSKSKPKPKPVTLNRVTYRKPGVCVGWNVYLKTFTRFTVRACIFRVFYKRFAVWDKKREDWLFHEKSFRTRAGARKYLRTTTVEDEEYKLRMVEIAMDRSVA